MRNASRPTVLFTLGLFVAAMAWAATNLNSSRSNIYRVGGATVMSATATMTGPNQTQAALSAPEAGEFVLTQVCTSPVNGGIRVAARDLAPLLHVGDPTCVSLHPGISIRPGSVVTCATTGFAAPGGEYFCTVSGLFSR